MTDLVQTLDVSNYQPTDLSALIQQHSIAHVIVRLWLPQERGTPAYAQKQINSARANGCTTAGYWWLYRDLDPVQQAHDACEQARAAGVADIPLWIDVEPYTDDSLPSVEQIQAAVDTCIGEGIRPGIYTGAWLWGRLGNTKAFASLPLWAALYNGQQDLEVPMFGGWTSCVGHQYQGDPDLSSFDPSVTAIQPPAPSQPSYEELQSIIGYLTGDLMNGFESEANRKPIRKTQLLALVELGRAQALT